MSTKGKVSLNIDELKEFLVHTVNNNKFLQTQGKVPLAVCVEGPAGIGKTSSVEQLAIELNLNFVKLNLAEIEEISDLVGFPIRQFQLCKGTECLWIDEQAVQEYTKNGFEFTGQKRMGYCTPEWIADKGENGIFLLDDFSRADSRFIQATMSLIDRQTYMSWKLPKGWNIILSTNPDDGNYQVTSLDVAQETRFSTVDLKFDIECWMRFAEKAGVDGRCINFLGMHPELVTEKCNARAITNFFNSISSFDDFSKNLPMIQLLGEGSVGPEFATLFTLFINNKLDKLISPLKILTGKVWSEVKKELKDCIGEGNNYRADIASILSTRLINYSTYYSEKNSITQAIIDRVIALTTEDVMDMDLRFYIVKKLLSGPNFSKFQPMMLHPEVVKMSVK